MDWTDFFFYLFIFAGLFVPTSQPNAWARSRQGQPRPLTLPPLGSCTSLFGDDFTKNSSSLAFAATFLRRADPKPSACPSGPLGADAAKPPAFCLHQELPSPPTPPLCSQSTAGTGPEASPPPPVAYRIYFLGDGSAVWAAWTTGASLPAGGGAGVRRRLEARGCEAKKKQQ